MDGRRSGSHHTVDPHKPQKLDVMLEPLSAARLNRVDDPWATAMLVLAKKAPMPKADPVRR